MWGNTRRQLGLNQLVNCWIRGRKHMWLGTSRKVDPIIDGRSATARQRLTTAWRLLPIEPLPIGIQRIELLLISNSM